MSQQIRQQSFSKVISRIMSEIIYIISLIERGFDNVQSLLHVYDKYAQKVQQNLRNTQPKRVNGSGYFQNINGEHQNVKCAIEESYRFHPPPPLVQEGGNELGGFWMAKYQIVIHTSFVPQMTNMTNIKVDNCTVFCRQNPNFSSDQILSGPQQCVHKGWEVMFLDRAMVNYIPDLHCENI